jgi:hypothetical protein
MDDSAVFEFYSRLNNIPYSTPQHATYRDFSNRFYCMSFGDEYIYYVDRLSSCAFKVSDLLRKLQAKPDNPFSVRFVNAIRKDLFHTAQRQFHLGNYSSLWEVILENGSVIVNRADETFLCTRMAFNENVLHLTVEHQTLVRDHIEVQQTGDMVQYHEYDLIKEVATSTPTMMSGITQAVEIKQNGRVIPGVYLYYHSDIEIDWRILRGIQVYTKGQSICISLDCTGLTIILAGTHIVPPADIVPRESSNTAFPDLEVFLRELLAKNDQRLLIMTHENQLDWKKSLEIG